MEINVTLIIILAIVIVVSLFVITNIFNYVVKINFSKQYGIGKMPRRINVKKKKGAGKNYYELNYPYWAKSKKDGTADRRVKNNSIIWQTSELFIDNYLVLSKRPYALLEVVKRLRVKGVAIDLCNEEKSKQLFLLNKKEAFVHNTDTQKLVAYYAEKPTDFERLCSKLFENMGYIAKLTPPTNDGGYDILLNKGTERAIVECKCYSIQHKVGRPSVQKLVGANNIVSAEKMIFITTSDFSSAAISYAEEAGVELINGYKLMELLEEQNFFVKENVEVSMLECQLQVSDMHPYVPNDIYDAYFL